MMNTVSRDEQFMRDALREAHQSAREGEIPVGGVVVCKGRVIARAHNLTETLTSQNTTDGIDPHRKNTNTFYRIALDQKCVNRNHDGHKVHH